MVGICIKISVRVVLTINRFQGVVENQSYFMKKLSISSGLCPYTCKLDYPREYLSGTCVLINDFMLALANRHSLFNWNDLLRRVRIGLCL